MDRMNQSHNTPRGRRRPARSERPRAGSGAGHRLLAVRPAGLASAVWLILLAAFLASIACSERAIAADATDEQTDGEQTDGDQQAASAEVHLSLVGGEVARGTLVAVDESGVSLAMPDGDRRFPLDQVLGLRTVDTAGTSGGPEDGSPTSADASPVESASVWLELTDGSRVPAAACTMDDDEAKLTLLDSSKLVIPAKAVRAARFDRPGAEMDEAWGDLLRQQREADRLIVRRGDTLDYHRGIVHGMNDEVVFFELDGETLDVKREKLFGLALLRPTAAELPPGAFRLIDRAGGSWVLQSVEGGRQLTWTTPAGVRRTAPVAGIARIDFSGGKVVYLSELEPRRVAWQPYFPTGEQLPCREKLFAPRMDQGPRGDPLCLDGVQYARGIALHSRAELEYLLPDQYQRLRAKVGIDESVRPHGDARLLIEGDGKPLADLRVRGTEPPGELDLEIEGIRRLTITVDFADGLDLGDWVTLADIKVTK